MFDIYETFLRPIISAKDHKLAFQNSGGMLTRFDFFNYPRLNSEILF